MSELRTGCPNLGHATLNNKTFLFKIKQGTQIPIVMCSSLLLTFEVNSSALKCYFDEKLIFKCNLTCQPRENIDRCTITVLVGFSVLIDLLNTRPVIPLNIGGFS